MFIFSQFCLLSGAYVHKILKNKNYLMIIHYIKSLHSTPTHDVSVSSFTSCSHWSKITSTIHVALFDQL